MREPIIPERRKALRRAAILNAARASFLQDGYQRTTMAMVAEDARVSKATVYSHYTSKSELFVAVCEEESQRTLDVLFDSAAFEGDFQTALETLVRRVATVLLSDDLVAFHRLVVAETANFPDIGEIAYECGIRRPAERVTIYFQSALARGELLDGDMAAVAGQFLALCLGRPYWQRLFGVGQKASEADIDALAKRAVATFLAAFAAKPAR
jgi:TetR/AcrR family transcriptional regulator, mexJK operon transcriptional repressor